MEYQSLLIDSSWHQEKNLALSTLRTACKNTGWECLINRSTQTDLTVYLMKQGEGWEASRLIAKLLPYKWQMTVENLNRIRVNLGR